MEALTLNDTATTKRKGEHMKREFLTELGLEKEVIDKVMAEHGKTLQETKQELETIKGNNQTLQEQLTQRDTDLKDALAKAQLNESQQTEFKALQEKYETEKMEWEEKLKANAKNASWEISIAKLGVIDPVAMRAHTKDFVEKAEFKDGAIVGFEEHAKELLSDKLKYLVPSDAKALGHEHQQPPKADTVQKQIAKGFGLENKEK